MQNNSVYIYIYIYLGPPLVSHNAVHCDAYLHGTSLPVTNMHVS